MILIEQLLADIRQGARTLWRDRLAMFAAAVSLALALGACGTAFALIDALILRPLPVSHADQLFYLTWPGQRGEQNSFSYPMFRRMREAAGSSLDLFAANWPVRVDPDFGRIGAISGNGFDILGIHPAAGRLLNEQDTGVAVISYALWERRFGADPSVIGTEVIVGGRPFHLVGVVQRDFTGLQPGYLNDVWISLTDMAGAARLADPGNDWIGVWGHAAPGSGAAEQKLQAAFTNFRRDHAAELLPPGTPAARLAEFVNAQLTFHNSPAGADSLFRAQFQRPLWLFGIFSALLLLIAASNVTNLFFARAIARRREMALRIAIGAGRFRLVRQLIAESALLALISVAGAIWLSVAVTPFLASQLGTSTFPSYLEIQPDLRLMAFLGAAAVLVTILVGVIPAFSASSVHPDEVLKATAKQSGRTSVLRPLVAIQVAFSFMALFLSGLLLSSYRKLIHVDLGFDKDHVILYTLNTKGANPDRQRIIAGELLDRVKRINGVTGAALSQQGLIGGVFAFVMTPSLRFPGRSTEQTHPRYVPVSPGFFAAMKIRLLSGTDVTARDEKAVAVNSAFVDTYLAGRNPIGQTFETVGDSGPVQQQIVGVVANSLFNNLREAVTPTVYPLLDGLNGATLEVRTEADPRGMAFSLRQSIEAIDPAVKVATSTLQTTRIDDTLVSERLLAWLGGFFAVCAFVLVAVGLHGMVAWFVLRRRNEIGIRMALGAERRSVLVLVVSSVARLMAVGIVFGAASGIALSSYVTSLLFDVKPSSAMSFALPLACILLACLVACLRPAIRAVTLDPVDVLRYE